MAAFVHSIKTPIDNYPNVRMTLIAVGSLMLVVVPRVAALCQRSL